MNAPVLSAQHKDAPHFVQLRDALGLGPLLAISDTLVHALTLATMFVLVQLFTAVLTRALARQISTTARVILALVFATLATGALLQSLLLWRFELAQALGIFAPLLAINAVVYLNALRGAQSRSISVTLRGVLRSALTIGVFVLLLGIVRETLGHGTLGRDLHLLLGTQSPITGWSTGPGWALLASPAGVFFLLGGALAGHRFGQIRATRNAPVAESEPS